MQKPYLPTAQEIEDMSMEEFESWVIQARYDLPKREEERNPLLHLKKRIPSIITHGGFSEEEREIRVLQEILRYYRIIAQHQ